MVVASILYVQGGIYCIAFCLLSFHAHCLLSVLLASSRPRDAIRRYPLLNSFALQLHCSTSCRDRCSVVHTADAFVAVDHHKPFPKLTLGIIVYILHYLITRVKTWNFKSNKCLRRCLMTCLRCVLVFPTSHFGYHGSILIVCRFKPSSETLDPMYMLEMP